MSPDTNIGSERHQVKSVHQSEGVYCCTDPVHPHMRSLTARRDTFLHWPGQTNATNEQMAEAGMFCDGIGDKTKCFHCGGGLQDWEYHDDPMLEHAKWYPRCEYILRKVGYEIVSSVSGELFNLPRPVPLSFSATGISERVTTVSNTTIIQPGAAFLRRISSFDVSPTNTRHNKFDEAMRHDLTKAMLSFGFSGDLIRKVVRRRIETSEMFENASDYLDAILAMENEKSCHESVGPQMSAATAEPVESAVAHVERNIEIMLNDLKEERRCKICFDRQTQCVFIPCGHFCTCMHCADGIRFCPFCRKRISNSLKVYTA